MLLKSLHIILALFLLCNTSGFNLTVHYCADAISAITLFTNPSSCTSMEKPCCSKNNGKKDCCSFETEFVQQDLDQINYSIDVTDLNIHSFSSQISTIDFGTKITNQPKISKYYRPPPKEENLYILFENFLC